MEDDNIEYFLRRAERVCIRKSIDTFRFFYVKNQKKKPEKLKFE